jgi:hypothetical protein
MWRNKYYGSQKIRILTLRWVLNLGVCHTQRVHPGLKLSHQLSSHRRKKSKTRLGFGLEQDSGFSMRYLAGNNFAVSKTFGTLEIGGSNLHKIWLLFRE